MKISYSPHSHILPTTETSLLSLPHCSPSCCSGTCWGLLESFFRSRPEAGEINQEEIWLEQVSLFWSCLQLQIGSFPLFFSGRITECIVLCPGRHDHTSSVLEYTQKCKSSRLGLAAETCISNFLKCL